MPRSMEFVKKLLRKGIVLENGPDYELNRTFVYQYEQAVAESMPIKEKRQVILKILDGSSLDFSDEELLDACLFIENFLED